MNGLAFRPARATDADAIRSLVNTVGINQSGLDWRRFLVAVDNFGGVIACGQVKQHTGGVSELASVAVMPGYRGRGIARGIIERLLTLHARPIYLMCRSSLGAMYEGFGFRPLRFGEMPRYFQRVSQLTGVVRALEETEERLLVMNLV